VRHSCQASLPIAQTTVRNAWYPALRHPLLGLLQTYSVISSWLNKFRDLQRGYMVQVGKARSAQNKV